jgi:hypothetical protein
MNFEPEVRSMAAEPEVRSMAATPAQPGHTDSGLEIKRLYRASDVRHDGDGLLSDPGVYPFVRGNFVGGYPDRLGLRHSGGV